MTFRLHILTCLALALAFVFPHAAPARDWAGYALRSFVVQAPVEWDVTLAEPDREYDFESPDKAYSMWAFWWFQDEPLLGFSDIIASKERDVAGHKALFIHSETPDERVFQLAFLDKDDAGEIFILHLAARGQDLAQHKALFEDLIARLEIDGIPVRAPTAALPSPSPTDQYRYVAAGDFSLKLPDGWDGYEPQTDAFDSLIVQSATKTETVLVLVTRTSGDMSALEHAEQITQQIKDGYFENREEHGTYVLDVAGFAAMGTKYTTDVVPIGKISFPYAQARVWVFTGGDETAAFSIFTIRALEQNPTQATQLAQMAQSLILGPPPNHLQAPAAQDQNATIPRALVNNTALMDLRARFGSDCRMEPTDDWAHPTRNVVLQSGVAVSWVALCGAHDMPVIAARFPFDPQGATDDYFWPLYHRMITATQGQPFAFVDLDGNSLLLLELDQDDLLSLTVEAWPPTGVQPAPLADKPTPDVIFQGDLGQDWRPISVSGGDFERFADTGPTGLRVAVPADNQWGKTGIASTTPLLEMPLPFENTSQQLTLAYDPAQTDQMIVALTRPDGLDDDPWSGHSLRLAVKINGPKDGELVLKAFQWTLATQPFEPGQKPGEIHVILRPDQIIEIADRQGNRLMETPLPHTVSTGPWHVQILCHAQTENAPTRLMLTQVDLKDIPSPQRGQLDAPARENQSVLAFDGRQLGRIWTGYETTSGAFSKLARFEDGVLRLKATGDQTGTLGIYSVDPVIWLDRLSDGAQTLVRIALDPDHATGVRIGLQTRLSNNGSPAGHGQYWASITRQPDGSYTAVSQIISQANPLEVSGIAAFPDVITLRLSQEGVAVEMPGFPSTPLPWDQIGNGVPLRLHVLTQADADTGGTQMGLRSVHIDTLAARPSLPHSIRVGAPPLPRANLLDLSTQTGWDGFETPLGREHVRLTQDGLSMGKPPLPTNSARATLLSDVPVAVLDNRVKQTPYRLQFRFDPDTFEGARIMLSPYHEHNMHESAKVKVIFARVNEGPNQGLYQLSLRQGYYSYWNRLVDPAWLAEHWRGDLDITLGHKVSAVDLGNGLTITGLDAAIHPGSKFFMTLAPGAEEQYAPGGFTLQRFTGGWAEPDGMSASQSMALRDDVDFDPAAYLRALSSEILSIPLTEIPQ